MAKAAADSNAGQKTIPADCVSVLLMALDKTTITKAQYELMSALDGSRTASSFEHQSRSITAKAKELKSRVDNGEKFEAVAPANKRAAGSATASPATPRKRKGAGDDNGTPVKKRASPKKKMASEELSNDLGDSGLDLPVDMDQFIKNEAGYEI
ncbi:hypothetical protein HBH70_175650 [Parastagonospora nodorum]|nr:hypothetical protein HBI09_191590 [Parastagonospora nodorum]KAH4159267.1 hypothetical protein HBH43_189340 [Parastagonospora nodorum]KAH4191566.1 hypothetical protein HBI95_211600 [Parastagonospora nodorum]KAH4253325.1 hypothetical protein HBI03_196200 [Parastagonospora nodorum]KAH4264931.1 hypothetical protein HBI04_185200 [Parastagonospora nodorum]